MVPPNGTAAKQHCLALSKAIPPLDSVLCAFEFGYRRHVTDHRSPTLETAAVGDNV
jgi:hypothetical protein